MNRYLYTCYRCNINFASRKCPRCGLRAGYKTELNNIPERDFRLEFKNASCPAHQAPQPEERTPYSKFFRNPAAQTK